MTRNNGATGTNQPAIIEHNSTWYFCIPTSTSYLFNDPGSASGSYYYFKVTNTGSGSLVYTSGNFVYVSGNNGLYDIPKSTFVSGNSYKVEWFNNSSVSLGYFTVAVTGVSVVPSAPSGVSCTVTGHSASLTWNANVSGENVTSYKVYLDSNLYGTYLSVQQVNFSALATGSHTFAVSAVNSTGEGLQTSVTKTVSAVTPSVVTGLIGTVSGHNVTLSWNANVSSEGVTSYKVYQGGNYLGSTSGTNYNVIDLAVGSYSFSVRAVNSDGEGIAGSCNVTVENVIGSVPVNVQAVSSFKTVTITWDVIEDVTGYVVYVDNVAVGNVSTNQYIFNAPDYGTYSIQVSSVGLDGEGSKSVPVTVECTPNLVMPVLSVTGIGGDTAKITWTYIPEATGYKVFDINGNLIQTLGQTATSYSLSNLQFLTSYTYGVCALYDDLQSEIVNVTFTTLEEGASAPIEIDLGITSSDIVQGVGAFFKSIWPVVALSLALLVAFILSRHMISLGKKGGYR